MCSVSLIRPDPGQLRVVMHRDEDERRPDSLPPVRRMCGNRLAVLTVDALAGGAWIGSNVAGLCAALLNHTGATAPTYDAGQSRGSVVPALLEASSLDEAGQLVLRLPLARLHPFTVVLATVRAGWAMRWDGSALQQLDDGPIHASSGLGDALVAGPRLQAWRGLTGDSPTAATQDAWHTSREGNDGAAWVLMRRPGARTVSRTVVTISAAQVMLSEDLLDAEGDSRRMTTHQLTIEPA